MTDKTPNNFVPNSGWPMGNLNAAPAAFQPPPYHQVTNFARHLPPSHFPSSSTNDSSNIFKNNAEYQKFTPAVCQTFNMNNDNTFEMNQYSNSKQPLKSNFLNPLPSTPHIFNNQNVPNVLDSLPTMPPNYPKPVCPSPIIQSIANTDRNFNTQQIPPLNSSQPINQCRNLPISESAPLNNSQFFDNKNFATSSNVPPYCNIVNIPSTQTINTCVQPSIPMVYSVPPPVVQRSIKVENTPDGISNLQNLRFLSPPFMPQNNQNARPFGTLMMVPPPPAYPQMPYPPMTLPTTPISSGEVPGIVLEPAKEKERLLTAFLKKFQKKEKEVTKSTLTVVEFRSALKVGLSLSRRLISCRENLSSLLQCSEDEWNAEKQRMQQLKDELSEVCSFLSIPQNLSIIQKKLQTIKKKREVKARLKQEAISARQKREQERKVLHQEIDKWMDGIKEKNLKLKREIEMKKEADKILSEVRRKIHEAKKTIEKLKVFEKLRSARQMNAQQKGLFVAVEHDAVFERKLNAYRDLLHKQVEVYEEEERALRVMLEEEQEGQLEEEVSWRREKLKSLQKRKQANIMQCLFGDTKDPSPENPLFLFYQHQNAGNCSIKNLVQIRHHWDDHLAENGDPVPQQWIVPVPPSSTAWEAVCQN